MFLCTSRVFKNYTSHSFCFLQGPVFLFNFYGHPNINRPTITRRTSCVRVTSAIWNVPSFKKKKYESRYLPLLFPGNFFTSYTVKRASLGFRRKNQAVSSAVSFTLAHAMRHAVSVRNYNDRRRHAVQYCCVISLLLFWQVPRDGNDDNDQRGGHGRPAGRPERRGMQGETNNRE